MSKQAKVDTLTKMRLVNVALMAMACACIYLDLPALVLIPTYIMGWHSARIDNYKNSLKS